MIRLLLILITSISLHLFPKYSQAQAIITKEDSVIIQRTSPSLVLKNDTIIGNHSITTTENLNTNKPTLQEKVSTFVIIAIITLSVILLYNVHSK